MDPLTAVFREIIESSSSFKIEIAEFHATGPLWISILWVGHFNGISVSHAIWSMLDITEYTEYYASL